MIKRKILIVESNEGISAEISDELTVKNYDVITAKTGRMAKEAAQSHCPDLMLLSSQLEDADGQEVLKDLREWSSMPVIMLMDRSEESDMVNALENGANDCLFSPYTSAELVSRVRMALMESVLEGSNAENIHSSTYQVGSLVIDYDRYCAYVSGRDVLLTQNEFRIVALLGKYAGRVLSYDYIIEQLWGPNARKDNQILRVNMSNIRHKIEMNTSKPRYILTVAGVGYLMADE